MSAGAATASGAATKDAPDKQDAYWTLYECLLTTAKLIAPFTPFLAETLWRNLAGVFGDRALESVHLCDYPACDAAALDERLSEQMRLLREIASLAAPPGWTPSSRSANRWPKSR